MRIWGLIIACLMSECVGLDLEHNCTFQNEIIRSMTNWGYPKIGDLPTLNRKIIRGARVSILEHPYIASIRRQMAHYLTGTLVNGNLVVTVAHPLVDVPIIELGVVLGQNYNDRGSVEYTVLMVVFHQHFDPYTLQADLALLRIHENIDVNVRLSVKSVWYFKKQDFKFDKHSLSAHVTGWGRCDLTGNEFCLPRASIYYKDEFSDPMLRSINIGIIENSRHCETYGKCCGPGVECILLDKTADIQTTPRIVFHEVNIDPGMLCVGCARQADHTCACVGVPGAPLVVDGALLGVLSWGFGCGYHTDLPLIYTDIRYYHDWLWNNIKVFSLLNERHFEQMYETTKLAIITAWFTATGNNVTEHIHPDTEIQPWKIDKELAMVEGNMYDIRDYFGRPGYHEEKQRSYELIRANTYEVSTTHSQTGDEEKQVLSHGEVVSSDTEYENEYEILDIKADMDPHQLMTFSNRTASTESLSVVSDDEYF